jgi:2-phosphosulfolactate phosphatase
VIKSLDVVPTADLVTRARVEGRTAVVIDVLRASTTMITALGRGAVAVVPVAEPDDALRRAGPGVLVAGERKSDKVAGFDLGNSPVEFSVTPLEGRTIVFTTSNGTRALLAARSAAAIGIAAFVNATAAVDWVVGQGRDTTIVCAGERGRPSLDDSACGGLIAARVRARVPGVELTPDAEAAIATARPYLDDLDRLAKDSPWAASLMAKGYGGDVRVCLRLDTSALVPLYLPDVDKVVLRPR